MKERNGMKTRIGFYVYTIAVGGGEQYLRDLLWYLNRERYEITLFYEPWKPLEQFFAFDSCPPLHLCPIPVYETTMHGREGLQSKETLHSIIQKKMRFILETPRNFARLKQAFLSNPVDILHISNGGYPGAWTAQLASLAAKSVGIPTCFMTIASTPMDNRSGPLWSIFDRKVAQSVDSFIAVAEYVGRVLVEKRSFPGEKIQTIYYGTRSMVAEISDQSRIATLQSMGISTDRIVIGIAARISLEKGHGYLLLALAKIREQIKDNVAVIIMGDGPYKDEIQSQSRALQLDDIITFTGRIPNTNIAHYLAACNLMILPSEIEGLPYMITEAMSLGKAVVATNVGGIPEQVVHGETGLLIEPRNPDALAEAILHLINNPALLQQMGGKAQQRYQSLFTLERMIQDHEALYNYFSRKD
jgi:glycosyltransferase involved in cell wall biosynthesis